MRIRIKNGHLRLRNGMIRKGKKLISSDAVGGSIAPFTANFANQSSNVLRKDMGSAVRSGSAVHSQMSNLTFSSKGRSGRNNLRFL